MSPSRTGRPRDDAADQRIMDAALLEYAAHGRAGFSFNGVARRAEVGKSSLYLRWQDKDALLADSVRSRAGSLALVDTGTLRGDLVALGADLLRFWLAPAGWVALRIAFDTAGDEEPPALLVELDEAHRGAAVAAVARAVGRGEVEPSFPAELLVQAVHGALMMQALRPGGTARAAGEDVEAAVSPIVQVALHGLQAQLR